MNRLTKHIDGLRPKVDALTGEQRLNFENDMAVDFEEHFAFQELKSLAFAMEKISQEEAQLIYIALGDPTGDPDNGGWAKDTDLATKVSITLMMQELLTWKLKLHGVK